MAEAIAFDIARGVISKLSSLALQQIGQWWNLKADLDGLKNIVSPIEEVILAAEEQSVTNNAVKGWLERLKEALYDADDLLDDFSTEALRKDLLDGNKLTKEVRIFFSRSNQFAYGLKMGRRIKAIKVRLNSIKSETSMLQLVKPETSMLQPVESSFMAKRRQQTHSFVRRDEIIGRDDDKKSLLKLLLESQNEENVFVIPIVGIGGLGKTALAQLVYNDEMVKDHFELRMWVCVSDVFDVKIIVENIIKSVTNKAPDQNLGTDQLQKQLREKIDRRRYLLVLDDVWNEEREKWFSLKKLLMDGAKGSRIIVTSRSQIVAKITSNCPPHVLKGLADDDAWLLFKEIAFEQRPAASTNPNFVETGKKILEKCGGVPLVIRTIAGTLSFKETESDWLSFKDNELAEVSQNEGEILPTLKLSYDHLPSHLKHCFACCGLSPKGHEIDVRLLIQLWIAQGFVKLSNPSQSLEDIGFDYFKDLVERSFFQEVETISEFNMYSNIISWSNWISCKMHDLMHDLAETVAGIESTVFDSESSTSEIDEKCRHLTIDSSLILSHEKLIPFFKAKKLRTFWFSNRFETEEVPSFDSIISNFRYLRVLKLKNSFNLTMVPRSIHKLKHLRDLDLSSNDQLKTLPKSICKLQNLLLLKLDDCWKLENLPKNIEKLVNLTHFGLKNCHELTHMPRGIGKLTSLQMLSMFVVDENGSHRHSGGDLSELSGLNNLRGELRITNLGYVKDAKKQFRAANLEKKQHLEWLALEWTGDNDDDDEKSLEDLQPHPNLKALSVKGWRGDARIPSWLSLLTNLVKIGIVGPSKFKHLPTFAHLPHLEALSIDGLTELEYMDDNGVDGRQGESELFFPSLTHLSLTGCPNMKSWWRRRIDGDNNYDGTSTKESLTLKNTSSRSLQQTICTSITSATPSTSSLPLSKLKIFDVKNIEELDSDLLDECLQNMTSLKSLGIGSCHWLKSLSGLLQHLTRLKHLEIGDCKELDLEGMQLRISLGNLSSLTIENIPPLLSLPFWLQHLSELKELTIKNCSGLKSLFPVFQHLTSLEWLKIIGCNDLELSAPDIQIFQDYTSLISLQLERIPNCRYLPEWLRHLTNLHYLHLIDLPNLTSLPDDMRDLTTLKALIIRNIPQLEERCRKGVGADWPKIAHIPLIRVDSSIS